MGFVFSLVLDGVSEGISTRILGLNPKLPEIIMKRIKTWLRKSNTKTLLLAAYKEIFESIVSSGVRTAGDTIQNPGAYTTGYTARRFQITTTENNEIELKSKATDWRIGFGSAVKGDNSTIEYIYPVRARALKITFPSGIVAFVKKVRTYKSLGRFVYIQYLFGDLIRTLVREEIRRIIAQNIFIKT